MTLGREAFAAIREAGEPVLLEGLVADWPLVAAARRGEASLGDYLRARAGEAPIGVIEGPAAIEGRFHYDDALRGLNFARRESRVAALLDRLAEVSALDEPPSIAAQGIDLRAAMPRIEAENPMPLLDPAVAPRAWIGNSAKVATHHDSFENLACVVAGRRRFTLFAPEQVANLYMGPFAPTPAGAQVSMAHVTAPDFERFPRFRAAMDSALTFDLEPGDAIYIPYHWYHHVESRGSLAMLVNYWWNDAPAAGGSPWDAMMLGLIALRQLPPQQRRAWRAMFDRYVFQTDGPAGAHLPEAARAILAADSDSQLSQMRRSLIDKLTRFEGGRTS
ncbi:cupin-like domain-containing protein [Sphingomonas sp. ASV193]|uniref:cupin-like domain-containing protein n=1 Tax=Sphingomonas sp. ASV193 TaxID=3144405 RepID=UPI0032E92EDF